jgi:NAD(P)-dependent dehydrogenase (short-subunit alcohol dehydrogenase family)
LELRWLDINIVRASCESVPRFGRAEGSRHRQTLDQSKAQSQRVGVTSIHAQWDSLYVVPSSVAKAGVLNMTRSLAVQHPILSREVGEGGAELITYCGDPHHFAPVLSSYKV